MFRVFLPTPKSRFKEKANLKNILKPLFKNRFLLKNLIIWSSIGLFMLSVSILSVFSLSKLSLRLDEAQSLWQTSRSVNGIIKTVSQDVHVPLYHLILHIWEINFGTGIPSIRFLSLVWYILSIPAVYLLAKTSFQNTSLALFSSLMFSLSPYMNWFGSEARMYSLLTLLVILNQFCFIEINRRHNVVAWLLLLIVSILGVFTHYFFWLILLVEFLFLVFNRASLPPRCIPNFITLLAILGTSFIPWVNLVLKEGGFGNSKPALIKPSSVDVFNTYAQFLFGFQNDYWNTLLVSLWPLLVLFSFLLLQKGVRKSFKEFWFFGLAAFLPAALALMVSLTFRPVFVSRYLIITLPALYLLIAYLLFKIKGFFGVTIRFLLIITMFLSLVHQTVSASTPSKESYREAVNFIQNRSLPTDAISVSAPFMVYPVEYYYRGPIRITTIPYWNRQVDGPIPSYNQEKVVLQIQEMQKKYSSIWVIFSYDQGYEEELRIYLDTHLERQESLEVSPKLNVYHYKLKYS